MAPKVTVLKVCISCDKCKAKLLKAIAGLEGVNKLETDEENGTLTVSGPVDPHVVITRARKAGKYAEIVSIDDPKKPDDDEKDKPEDGDKKKDCEDDDDSKCCKLECGGCCKACRLKYVTVPFEIPAHYSQPSSCIIM